MPENKIEAEMGPGAEPPLNLDPWRQGPCFKRKPVRVLLDATDRRVVFSELRRIGNNVNQIAKRMNSGFFEGWHPEFQTVANHLATLERYLVGRHGLR
jgi:hypothetical protein